MVIPGWSRCASGDVRDGVSVTGGQPAPGPGPAMKAGPAVQKWGDPVLAKAIRRGSDTAGPGLARVFKFCSGSV